MQVIMARPSTLATRASFRSLLPVKLVLAIRASKVEPPVDEAMQTETRFGEKDWRQTGL
jgi:hypothetical protein